MSLAKVLCGFIFLFLSGCNPIFWPGEAKIISAYGVFSFKSPNNPALTGSLMIESSNNDCKIMVLDPFGNPLDLPELEFLRFSKCRVINLLVGHCLKDPKEKTKVKDLSGDYIIYPRSCDLSSIRDRKISYKKNRESWFFFYFQNQRKPFKTEIISAKGSQKIIIKWKNLKW